MINHSDGIFEFELGANPELVALVRRSALDFVGRLVEAEELRSMLEVAIHELLENSVKYVARGSIQFELRVDRISHVDVAITTRNEASPEDIRWLRKEVQRLRSGNRHDLYRDAMTRAVRNPGQSRLGLSRIASESNMDLSFQLLADGVVEIVARTPQGWSQLPGELVDSQRQLNIHDR